MHPKQDYSYALNREKQLTHIDNAIKGNQYYCPCCGAVMTPRQGKKNRWHFAHKANIENCSYETYLHKLAKIRIQECFNQNSNFNITFNQECLCDADVCSIKRFPRCGWFDKKTFDLKKYYNRCEQEVPIKGFVADLLISDNESKYPPILFEIYVSHKCSEDKINSGLRIIEIHIDSENVIEKIISSASITESFGEYLPRHSLPKNDITFYNFKIEKLKTPPIEFQHPKFRFWINQCENFKFDETYDYTKLEKCLSPIKPEIADSVFSIESSHKIDWNWAFEKLRKTGLKIKFCAMCNFYRYNDYESRCMCILYKKMNSQKYPRMWCAKNCPNFKYSIYNPAEYNDSDITYTARAYGKIIDV
ncbi:MAG: hypothetical protein K2N08_05220 [Muribaculaceae bacterium]|nr:hypothetical protein [Muribaculaceae bacterium]